MQPTPNKTGKARDMNSKPAAREEADAIGVRLRETRINKGLTLGQLAEQTGLSTGSISQVERGLVSPTIRTVYAITDALGVTPASIFDPDGAQSRGAESPYIVRRAAQPQVLDSNGVRKILASPSEQDRYKAYFVHIEPGGTSGDDSYAHNGEEVGYVMKGTFSLHLDGRTFLLGEGDCFAFPSSLKHRFFNDGETAAEIIWINSHK